MDESYHRAKKRVEDLKGFYGHLTAYIIVNVFLFVIYLLFTPGSFPWFLFVTFFWGIGLVSHAISVSNRGFFSKDWEDRKIKQYMDEEKVNDEKE